MGNLTSCFIVKHKKTMLIDLHGNLREIKVPTTAAEIMILEQPGHLISSVDDLVSSFRLVALRADEVLANGKLYLLIPAGRLNSFVKDSELEMLRASCKSRKNVKRRRNSKVLPAEEGEYVMINEVISEGSVDNLGVTDLSLQAHRKRNYSSMWTPVLEPIYE